MFIKGIISINLLNIINTKLIFIVQFASKISIFKQNIYFFFLFFIFSVASAKVLKEVWECTQCPIYAVSNITSVQNNNSSRCPVSASHSTNKNKKKSFWQDEGHILYVFPKGLISIKLLFTINIKLIFIVQFSSKISILKQNIFFFCFCLFLVLQVQKC